MPEPGQSGFLVRDRAGRIGGTLAMGTDHGALTMSAEELARSLGISAEHVDDHAKEPKV